MDIHCLDPIGADTRAKENLYIDHRGPDGTILFGAATGMQLSSNRVL